jgi:hypothetical protein
MFNLHIQASGGACQARRDSHFVKTFANCASGLPFRHRRLNGCQAECRPCGKRSAALFLYVHGISTRRNGAAKTGGDVMRKIAIIGMALALSIGSPISGGASARAGETSGAQARSEMPSQRASGQDPEFNSYWFVYGTPPYDGGVAPWKRPEANEDPGFDSYWFVYGVPPYDGGVAPWKRSQAVQSPASGSEK